ncbi:hypothetical protein [Halomarina litorea]|uniref:hypothetical protein n=1 Tax=Halomarina litorea TaxID=2961595 RepID=UPI0020C43820|nr:hypothetical protein [Halomarina sp. BCD28]
MDWLTAYYGLFVRVGLYLLIFWPTVGYYVYRDSTKRGLSSPKLRGVVYGVFGILGLLVYLAQKQREKTDSA